MPETIDYDQRPIYIAKQIARVAEKEAVEGLKKVGMTEALPVEFVRLIGQLRERFSEISGLDPLPCENCGTVG